MAWTLSPDSIQGGLPAAYLLSTLEFDEIRITFTLPGIQGSRRVTAKHVGDAVTISARDVEGVLQIPIIPEFNVRFDSVHRSQEPGDIIASHLNEQRKNSVLQYLTDLPGPLYLPLDRRWPEIEEARYRRPRNRRALPMGQVPINEVMLHVDRAHRNEQIITERLNYELRNKLLASLFEAPNPSGLSRRLLPMQELKDRRERIVTTLNRLGVPNAESETRAFFDALEHTVQQLEGHDLNSIGPDDPLRSTWVNWVIYGSPLANRVERLVALIEEYESRACLCNETISFLFAVSKCISEG